MDMEQRGLPSHCQSWFWQAGSAVVWYAYRQRTYPASLARVMLQRVLLGKDAWEQP